MTRAELKNTKSLLTRKGRKIRRKFIAEGVRLLEEALRHKRQPERIYYSPAILSDRGSLLVEEFAANGVMVEKIPARQLESISDSKSPQGIIGIFRTPETALMEPARLQNRSILLCENISDPGNLGSLARSALAFGFGIMVLTGRSVEPYSPKVVRSSAGAVFGLAIMETGTADIIAAAEKAKIVILASVARGENASTIPTNCKNGILLAIGSESEGLSEMILEKAQSFFLIRHRGSVESLNAAVAGSIIMSLIYNQRRGR